MDLSAIIRSVPEVVWGMTAGSFFSVLAVVLTNRANLRRLKLQLEHEREEKRKDRDMTLRRDLYLEAAEAISVGVDAVGALGDLSRSVEELMGPAIDRTAAITKVYLVAGEDTIAALARFVQDLSVAHARLLPQRLKVDSISAEIDRIEQTMRRAAEKRDKIVALMEAFHGADVPDTRHWAALQEKAGVQTARIDELQRRRQRLEDELLPAQVELLRACQAAVRNLNTSLVPVLTSVRRELDIPLNEGVLLGVIEADARSQSELIDDLFREAAAARERSQPSVQAAPLLETFRRSRRIPVKAVVAPGDHALHRQLMPLRGESIDPFLPLRRSERCAAGPRKEAAPNEPMRRKLVPERWN